MAWFKQHLLYFLKGLAMGFADAIPGVSGGTIALISGIYEKLINSIKAFDVKAFQFLRGLQFRKLWEHVNGSFLAFLTAGIAVSLITLSHFVTYLLSEYPIQIWSFFFGLIVISSMLVLKGITKWKVRTVFSFIIGTAIAYYITIATPAATPTALWFIFLSGVIAICAMILPGISGAFLLLMMGKYEYVYLALRDMKLVIIAVFALGAITGLLSFSRVISWLLKNYHNAAIALLSGFMVGSLSKIWPWKIVTLFRQNSSGVQVPLVEKNILPGNYLQLTGKDPFVLQALLFMALGFFVVFLLEKIGNSAKIAK